MLVMVLVIWLNQKDILIVLRILLQNKGVEINKKYLNILNDYNLILRQRNEFLKIKNIDYEYGIG